MENVYIRSIFDFVPNFDLNGNKIEYRNLTEVVQGGPLVGYLFINGNRVSPSRFGGPLLYDNGFIFAPMLLTSGFILVKIRIKDNEFWQIGNEKDIICLKCIDSNRIYFYDSLYSEDLRVYDLSLYKISNEMDIPTTFHTRLSLNNHIFEFTHIGTIYKGIKIASLKIDDKAILSHRFSSPFLFNDSQILIPIYQKRLFKSGFKIAIIDITDLKMEIRGPKENIFRLYAFENCNKVIYSTEITGGLKKTIII